MQLQSSFLKRSFLRRSFLKFLPGVPLAGTLAQQSASGAAKSSRDFLRELGVRPIINAGGMQTMFTGSLMQPEVVSAIAATSHNYVRLDELHDAVGRRIASLLKCEAAMVPSGAYGALLLGTAASITGTNPELILRIPDLTGMKSEVLIQKSHRYPYDHAIRSSGARLVEVETPEDVARAISEKTAMMLFLNKGEPLGRIGREEWVALGRRHGIPTMIDAAADVPPVDNLFAFTRMGFDLAAFSGGKGIRGPQSAGLLLGRADLIHAARLNTVPNSDSIGRGLKVNKEEMVGMMVAVENYLKRDHDADWRTWEGYIRTVSDSLSGLPHVRAERFVPPVANHVPHLHVSWDRARLPLTPDQVAAKLRAGEPSIEAFPLSDVIEISSWTLEPGEAAVVGRSLRAVLEHA